MWCILTILHSIESQSTSNPNTILFNRLMGGYRIDFNDSGTGCNRTEWENSDKDINNFDTDFFSMVITLYYIIQVQPGQDNEWSKFQQRFWQHMTALQP